MHARCEPLRSVDTDARVRLTMTIHLRQICLVADQHAKTVDDLSTIFGLHTAYIDPGVIAFGLENTLLTVGRNFLEIVSPVQEKTAAGRYLERRGGDGGYMVITQTESKANQQEVRQRALDNGVRIAYERDGDVYDLCQIHPGDMIASFLEIDWDKASDFTGHWEPVGGTGWESSVDQSTTQDFLGVELQGDDPEKLAKLWSTVTGLPLVHEAGVVSLRFSNAALRFVEAVDGRGAGLGGIDLAVNDRTRILSEARARDCYVSDDRVDVCGVRFYLHDA